VVIERCCDRHHLSARDLDAFPAGLLPKPENIANRASPQFRDEKLNVDTLFEAERPEEVARRIHSRPANRLPVEVLLNAKAERAKESVLGVLHHAVKIGEVHDACHIRLRELHAAR
jgi:hypothetical protein